MNVPKVVKPVITKSASRSHPTAPHGCSVTSAPLAIGPSGSGPELQWLLEGWSLRGWSEHAHCPLLTLPPMSVDSRGTQSGWDRNKRKTNRALEMYVAFTELEWDCSMSCLGAGHMGKRSEFVVDGETRWRTGNATRKGHDSESWETNEAEEWCDAGFLEMPKKSLLMDKAGKSWNLLGEGV